MKCKGRAAAMLAASLAIVSATTLARAQAAASANMLTASPVANSASANSTAPLGRPAATTAGPLKNVDPDYLIGPEDIISVNVWHESEISRVLPVRTDGRISLPLIGEVTASGMTPQVLQMDVRKKLQAFITDPDVTVIVMEMRSQHFNILGEVAKPGIYHFTRPMTVLDALAVAGGIKDFAKTKKMYLIRYRADGTTQRMRVNYKEVLKGVKSSANIELQPRDTVVVP